MTSDTLHPAWRVLKTPYDLKTNPFQFSEANRHGSDAVIIPTLVRWYTYFVGLRNGDTLSRVNCTDGI